MTETQTEFFAAGGAPAGFFCDGTGYGTGASISGMDIGVSGVCVGTAGNGVVGQGAGPGVGVVGIGGPAHGAGVLAQGGVNGVAIVAEATIAQIRMVPSVSVGAGNPNTAKIPGEPGDLLAVSKPPDPILLDDTVATLWFNAGGATPWKQLF